MTSSMPEDWLGQPDLTTTPAMWVFLAACCVVAGVIMWLARRRG